MLKISFIIYNDKLHGYPEHAQYIHLPDTYFL